MKAAIRLGRDYLANLVVYKNTNFEEMPRLFNTTQKTDIGAFWRYSECAYDWKHIAWTRSTLSHDPVIQWTSKITCILRFPSVLGEDVGPKRCNYNMGRSSGINSNVSYKHCCDRWRSSWIRVDYFGIFDIAESSRDPEWLAKTKHVKFKNRDHLHVSIQRYWSDNERKRWDLFFEFRKVKEYAKIFSQRHWTFLGPRDE